MALGSKSRKKPVLIKHLIHKRLAGVEESRGYKVIHASDLTKSNYCPRMVRLFDVTGRKPRGEFIGTSMRLTFQHGNDTNVHIAEDWLSDIVVGDWHCTNCGHIHEFRKRPQQCVMCGGRQLRHLEVRFQSTITGASCGVDALVDVGEPGLRVVEVKTIDKDEFKSKYGKTELVAPLAEHKERTNFYLRIIRESDHPQKGVINTKFASILYRSKGFGCKDPSLAEAGISDAPFSPFKEFLVYRDDEQTDYLAEKARIVFESRKNGTIPDGPCSNAFCDMAKGCQMVKACFSGKYPATMELKNE